MADFLGAKSRTIGSCADVVPVPGLEGLIRIEAELSRSVLLSVILSRLASPEPSVPFIYKRWKSVEVLVRCSSSSLVECCGWQLQFHTTDRAVNTLLACRQKRHTTLVSKFLAAPLLCSRSILSSLICSNFFNLSLQLSNLVKISFRSFSDWLNLNRYNCHLP